jgi:hypothetical protein
VRFVRKRRLLEGWEGLIGPQILVIWHSEKRRFSGFVRFDQDLTDSDHFSGRKRRFPGLEAKTVENGVFLILTENASWVATFRKKIDSKPGKRLRFLPLSLLNSLW